VFVLVFPFPFLVVIIILNITLLIVLVIPLVLVASIKVCQTTKPKIQKTKSRTLYRCQASTRQTFGPQKGYAALFTLPSPNPNITMTKNQKNPALSQTDYHCASANRVTL
jgi:hypothetical protein